MTFRDDREAAHRRADALQQELQAARDELATLKGGGPRTGRLALVLVGLCVSAGALGAVAWVVTARSAETRRASAARAAQIEAQRRAEEEMRQSERALQVAAEEARSRLAQDQRIAAQAAAEAEANANAPVEEITWRGELDAIAGADLSPGVSCVLTAGYSAVGGALRARSLVLRCGDQELYRAPPEALRTAGLREGAVYGSDQHVYLLFFNDEAPSAAPRAAVRISTLQHTATIVRGGPSPLRATVFLRDVSEARAGAAFGVGRSDREPAFAGVIERSARVTRVEGSAGVARGDRCAFHVRPVWEYPESCRIALRCGSTWLYGAREAGYLTCEIRNGRAVSALDENPTTDGGDPRITWRGARVTVSDFSERGAWSVDLAL